MVITRRDLRCHLELQIIVKSKHAILSVQSCVLTDQPPMMLFIGCKACGQTSAFPLLRVASVGELQH